MNMTDSKPWYQQPLVWMLIGIPFSAVVMGLLTAYLAVESSTGLVVDDYYEKGKAINLDLARDTAAKNYQLSCELDINFSKRVLQARLHTGNLPARPETLKLGLYHATRKGFDEVLTLTPTADGTYQASIPPLVPGHWYLELSDGDWRLSGSHIFPGSAQIILNPRN
jgi:hypothetical protein